MQLIPSRLSQYIILVDVKLGLHDRVLSGPKICKGGWGTGERELD